MYAAMTTTHGTSEDMVELARMAGEGMATWMRGVEGFEGILVLSSNETGTTQVVTLWESEEVARRNQEARMRLRDRVTETVDVEVLETVPYVVAFAELPAKTSER